MPRASSARHLIAATLVLGLVATLTGQATTAVPATALSASDVVLVADIDPDGDGLDGAIEVAPLGDGLVFAADDGTNGRELWFTDGTEDGTIMVADIAPEAASSDPSELTASGTSVFFHADDGTNGRELWVTDGTEDGTIMLADIEPGGDGSQIEHLVAIGTSVLFKAKAPDVGAELWISDGTEDGTGLLQDINEGANSSSPRELTRFGDNVLFSALDNDGFELWFTDGTEAGTRKVQDLEPGIGSGNPADFTTFGDQAVFVADNGTDGRELWITDGTDEGTELVLDIRSGGQSGNPTGFAVLGDHVLFTAGEIVNGRELWRTDGTADGTTLVSDIREGNGDSDIGQLTVLGDVAVFTARDTDHGDELWSTDGTEAGTVMLGDLRPGSVGSFPDHLTRFGDAVVFSATDGDHGTELWSTNGSESGTRLLADIRSGSAGSNPAGRSADHDRRYPVVGDELYLVAGDGQTGAELWRLTASQRIGQHSPGVSGMPEVDDGFGSSLATGDFDGDGGADLVVGVPREDLGDTVDAGMIHVLMATSAERASDVDNETIHQGTEGVAGAPEAGDLFGSTLAVGDFDDDGHDDLAIGVPGESIGDISDAGAVVVLLGSPTGLTRATILHQDTKGVAGAAEAGDRFGSSLAVGDFDDDGHDDLAIGVPGESIGDISGAGAVNVVFGSADGLTTSGDQMLHQDTDGLGGTAETGDSFGATLASGDLDDDDFDDLAIGSPGEAIGTHVEAGLVHLVPGSGTGLRADDSRQILQGSMLPGSRAEAGDRFGAALAVGDTDADGIDDLAVGSPGEAIGSTAGAGLVQVITARGDVISLHQDRDRVTGRAEPGDGFGTIVMLVDVVGDSSADLVVGTPGEDIGDIADGGMVHLFPAATGGIATEGHQTFHHGIAPLDGTPQADERLGSSITVRDGQFVLGGPGAAIDEAAGAGGFSVLTP